MQREQAPIAWDMDGRAAVLEGLGIAVGWSGLEVRYIPFDLVVKP